MSEVLTEEKTESPAEPTPDTTQDAPVEERAIVFEEALEAILFAAGHPVTYATLARVFEMTPSKVKDLVFQYSLKYNDSDIARGVILLTYSDSCQLCTKKYYLPEIREALGIKKSGTLSTSSMEALAIVAYNQPVTRVFVDTLRRADSSYAMNNLIDRGLIECKGRLDVPGRPMLYGTTTDFLRCFGLPDLASLPATSEELADMFTEAKEKTMATGDEQMSFEDVEKEIETEAAAAQSAEEDANSLPADSLQAIDDEYAAEDDIVDI